MKIFCMDCGTRIEFADRRPNFCFSCGCKLSLAKVEKPKRVEVEEFEEEDESFCYDQKYKLPTPKIDISELGFGNSGPLTLQGLMSAPPTQIPPHSRPLVPKNGKQELKKLQDLVAKQSRDNDR